MYKKILIVSLVILSILIIILFLKMEYDNLNVSPETTNDSNVALIEEKVENNQDRTIVFDDCSIEIPLNLIDDTRFDSENKILTVYWTDDETQENIKRNFLYSPDTNFVGCSDSVRVKMEEIKSMLSEMQ